MTIDNTLYADVMGKLEFEPSIDARDITISIKEGGIVVLGGTVKSYTEKYLAEKAVEKVEKVRGIANELEVNLAPTYKKSDADIAKAALDVLKWTLFIPYEQIKVSVENGHLTLTGEVEHNYQKERAREVVHNLYGLTYVTNNIKVKSGITPTEVKSKIIKEFERNAQIDANNIQVEVEGGNVTLKGRVRNFDEYREAKNAAWSVPGVTHVIDNLTLGR